MPRKKAIRKAPSYHARLFHDKDEAYKWLDRMKLKMARAEPEEDYTFNMKWSDEYELWHARFWNHRDGEGYNTK